MNPSIPGLALRRLAQIDPEAARVYVRRQVESGSTQLAANDMEGVDLKPSPSLDAVLLSQYKQGKPVDTQIALFATEGIKDVFWQLFDVQVKSAHAEFPKRAICVSPLWSYFYRVDPDQAAARLKSQNS